MARLPGLLALAAAFAVAAALLASAPAFTAAVGDVLADAAVDELPADRPVLTLQGFAEFGPDTAGARDAVVDALAAVPGLRDPVATLALGDTQAHLRVGTRATTARVTLLARAGAASAVDVVADGGPAGGVLVSETVAATLAVGPGDTVTLVLRRSATAVGETGAGSAGAVDLPVRGVYRDFAGAAAPPYFRGVPPELLPQSLAVFGGLVEPQLLIVEPAHLQTLLDGAAPGLPGRLWWQAFVDPSLSGADDVATLAGAVAGLDRATQDPFTGVGGALAQGGVGGLVMRTELADLAAQVDDGIERIEPAVGSVQVAAGAVGLLVVGLGGWFAAVRRRRLLRVWAIEGRAPWAVALRTTAAAGPAAVVGVAVGGAAGPALVRAFGPSTVAHPEAAPWGALIGFASVGLAMVAVATATAASRALTPGARRAHWAWDLALYGGAAALVAQALVRGSRADPGALDVVGLLVPVAGIGAAVAAGGRVVGWLAHRVRQRGGGLGAAWLLAWRRTAAALGDRLSMVLPVALAAGVAVFAAGVVASVDAGLDAKSRIVVGGDVAMRTTGPPVVTELPAGATVIRTGTASVQTGSRLWLVVVDPDGFAAATGWDPSFGLPADEFLARLAPTGGDAIPAIAAGPEAGTVPRTGAVRPAGLSLPFETVGELTAVPRMTPLRPSLVMRSDAIAAWAAANPGRVPAAFGVDPDVDTLLRTMSRFVIAADAAGDVEALLAAAGERVSAVETRAALIGDPAFSGQRWAFDYLRLVALAALMLAFVVFAFALAARRRQMVVAEALTGRMGLGRWVGASALAVEVGALTVVATGLGLGAAAGLGWLVIDEFDPLPEVLPSLPMILPATGVAAVVALAAGLASLAWLGAWRAARTGDMAEVLRG